VHTSAAESQSFYKHLLAYVKQNLKLTNYRDSPIAILIIALMLAASACATRPRNFSSVVQISSDLRAAERGSLININTATPEELENLPGVGKVIAERIVAQREQYGPFRRPEHLMMVRGISDRKFREIRKLVTVE
jgi:competence ComEA-like helix-hairpin-helix protein